ncbi:cryptochrome/photolyase family protein [Paenibacillus massiliensis]|uniref:cryptochrome/photolyase family protein n=1 Tax=Paenibacillus massiliensis TaxID=225917 RepID=UPI00048BEE18|nr:deoxyribodipyrimidine photo-lyase [Paenibacillus massiliensis]
MKLFIHRKDLRVEDMMAFEYLHQQGEESMHLLILDPFLLRNGREREHSGQNFLRHVARLRAQYREVGAPLHVLYGEPSKVVEHALSHYPVSEVVLHRDFTPYARKRDCELQQLSAAHGVSFTALTDHMMIDVEEFVRYVNKLGYYKVFAAFHRRWLEYLEEHATAPGQTHLRDLRMFSLEGYMPWPDSFDCPEELLQVAEAEGYAHLLQEFIEDRLTGYDERRDEFGEDNTSQLSPHMAVGAVSIRKLYQTARPLPGHDGWVRQLAFRDFYLYRSIYEENYFQYEDRYDLSALHDEYFERWCRAETGIPIIDAGMTELNTTGRMPNRIRILCATFLVKNLQCPFYLGERYFRRKLLDYDNTQNRGNWLFCASLGVNAAPYFRVNNPVTQSATLDPEGSYIRRWLPALEEENDKQIHLPRPDAIVDLKLSRQLALETYKVIVNSFQP